MIQEINRAYDQPSMVAEYLIDRAAFGEHPLGRTVLGPEENLRSFTREGIVAFRERRWAGARGGAFLAGNLDHLPSDEELHEALRALPGAARAGAPTCPPPDFAPETLVEERDTNQSHLRMIYRPDIAVADVRERAALSIYSTLLGGSMGSRLFEEIREKRGPLLLGLRDRPRLRRRADPAARLGPGVGEVRRGLHAHARDRRRAAQRRPHRGGGRARPRLRRRAARAGVREHRRRRPPRRQPADRLRRGHRPRRRRSRRSTRSPSTRCARSPRASPRSSRSPASARTRPTSSEPPAAGPEAAAAWRHRTAGVH